MRANRYNGVYESVYHTASNLFYANNFSQRHFGLYLINLAKQNVIPYSKICPNEMSNNPISATLDIN